MPTIAPLFALNGGVILRNRPAFAIFVLFVSLLVTSAPALAVDPHSAELTVEPVGDFVAGLPMRFKLTVKNIGVRQIPAYNTVAGKYRDGQAFRLFARNGDEKRTLHLWTGKVLPGAAEPIAPGATWSIFVAADPMPAGDWSLTVSGNGFSAGTLPVRPVTRSAGMIVTIRNDPATLKRIRADLLKAAQDPANAFARFVAAVYGIDDTVDKDLRELASDDDALAAAAVVRLRNVRRLSDGGDDVLMHALQRLSERKSKVLTADATESLAVLARRNGTNRSLEVAKFLVEIAPHKISRHQIIREIGGFRQLGAMFYLVDLLGSEEPSTALAAAHGLARHGGADAATPLLRIAKDPQRRDRDEAIRSLGGLKHLPEVKAFLEETAKDKTPHVAGAALSAMHSSRFDDDPH